MCTWQRKPPNNWIRILDIFANIYCYPIRKSIHPTKKQKIAKFRQGFLIAAEQNSIPQKYNFEKPFNKYKNFLIFIRMAEKVNNFQNFGQVHLKLVWIKIISEN